MIPVYQTDYSDKGNCFAACVASVLEMPLEEMPDHYAVEPVTSWLNVWQDFLRPFGLSMVAADDYDVNRRALGYAIATCWIEGKPKQTHAVVMRDGKFVHNPMANRPELPKLIGYAKWFFFTVVDPKKIGANNENDN